MAYSYGQDFVRRLTADQLLHFFKNYVMQEDKNIDKVAVKTNGSCLDFEMIMFIKKESEVPATRKFALYDFETEGISIGHSSCWIMYLASIFKEEYEKAYDKYQADKRAQIFPNRE